MKHLTIKGKSIYLDANIFIYLLEGYADFIRPLTQIFNCIDSGKLKAYTSELTIAEVLVKPITDDNKNLQQLYKDTLEASNNLGIIPISKDILIAAAQLRAKSLQNNNNIRLPDAIHVATANICGCDVFLTNDQKLQSLSNINVLLMSEMAKSPLITLV